MTDYTIQCSWCGLILRQGDPGEKISHGICPACYDKMMAKIRPASLLKTMDPALMTAAEMQL